MNGIKPARVYVQDGKEIARQEAEFLPLLGKDQKRIWIGDAEYPIILWRLDTTSLITTVEVGKAI